MDEKTNLVTISIGGNDVKFSKILEFCFFSADCTEESFQGISLRKYITDRLKVLGPKLDKVYAQIHKQAPDARIIVAGYPQLFPGLPNEQNCFKLAQKTISDKSGRRSVGFSQKEQNFLRGQTSRLNQVIAAHVQKVSSATFIPVDGWFLGHEICGGSGEWINGPTLDRHRRPNASPLGVGRRMNRYNLGNTTQNPLNAFLCFHIAIEGLAAKLAQGKLKASAFYGLAKEPKAERKKRIKNTFDKYYQAYYATDLEKLIKESYFEGIVPIRHYLQQALTAVFGEGHSVLGDYFKKNEGIWDVRGKLVHEVYSEWHPGEYAKVQRKRFDLEQIAKAYN